MNGSLFFHPSFQPTGDHNLIQSLHMPSIIDAAHADYKYEILDKVDTYVRNDCLYTHIMNFNRFILEEPPRIPPTSYYMLGHSYCNSTYPVISHFYRLMRSNVTIEPPPFNAI